MDQFHQNRRETDMITDYRLPITIVHRMTTLTKPFLNKTFLIRFLILSIVDEMGRYFDRYNLISYFKLYFVAYKVYFKLSNFVVQFLQLICKR